MSRMPLVSVTVLAYNHEKYIGEAIDSVLRQTLADLEVVVVDDGSTDGTSQVIGSFRDPRLISIRQDNQGPSVAANRALQACRGRYIALMSGDDVCHPDRLQRQLEEYRRGSRRLLFSAVDFIDEEGTPLARPSFCEGWFDFRPQRRAEIIHRFFHRGNFINAITCFTETEILRQSGYCDPLLLQLQDFDLWIRLVKKYEFQFLPQPTLSYRIRDAGQNLSAPNPRRLLRCMNETYFIMRRFFDDLDADLFREAFWGELLRPECNSAIETACEQAFLFLNSASPVHRLIGTERLHELMRIPTSAEVLRDHYHFNLLAFTNLLAEVEPFSPIHDWRTKLYIDSGKGFSEYKVCHAAVDFSHRRFTITFDVAGAPALRYLRWDPCEGRLCRVRIEEMVWQTHEGKEGSIDLSKLETNGVPGEDGMYTFETTDPMFVIPCTEAVSTFSIRGSWEVQTLGASFNRFLALMADRVVLQRELASQRAWAAALEQQLQSILSSRRWRAANKVRSLWRLLTGKRAA